MEIALQAILESDGITEIEEDNVKELVKKIEGEAMENFDHNLNEVITKGGYVSEDDVPDCDNCDERKGDPPDHSWRD